MNLALKVVEGPLKNKVFRVKDGLTIGRQGSGIALNDEKVSSLHAVIRKTGDSWILRDTGSKNGVMMDGHKADAFQLTPGIIFFVGDNGFQVRELSARTDRPKAGKNQRYWYEVLADFINKKADHFRDRPKPLAPLSPALVLEFVRGVQVNSKWVLGFGPRKIGANSLDLPIWEPGAPEICFEIIPTAEGLLFRTDHPEVVKLNGEKVDTRVLRMGDNIRIHDTLIEVDFSE